MAKAESKWSKVVPGCKIRTRQTAIAGLALGLLAKPQGKKLMDHLKQCDVCAEIHAQCRAIYEITRALALGRAEAMLKRRR